MKRVCAISSILFGVALISCGSGGSDEALQQGDACGVGISKTCEGNLFCEYPIGDCSHSKGTCVALPEVCAMIYSPVCGCDGVTYGNACEAKGHGVSLRTERECQ